MTGVEPWISDIESDRSTSWATATSLLMFVTHTLPIKHCFLKSLLVVLRRCSNLGPFNIFTHFWTSDMSKLATSPCLSFSHYFSASLSSLPSLKHSAWDKFSSSNCKFDLKMFERNFSTKEKRCLKISRIFVAKRTYLDFFISFFEKWTATGLFFKPPILQNKNVDISGIQTLIVWVSTLITRPPPRQLIFQKYSVSTYYLKRLQQMWFWLQPS